jgi:hypothetical protein
MFKNGNRTHEMFLQLNGTEPWELMGIEPMNMFKNGNRTHATVYGKESVPTKFFFSIEFYIPCSG